MLNNRVKNEQTSSEGGVTAGFCLHSCKKHGLRVRIIYKHTFKIVIELFRPNHFE